VNSVSSISFQRGGAPHQRLVKSSCVTWRKKLEIIHDQHLHLVVWKTFDSQFRYSRYSLNYETPKTYLAPKNICDRLLLNDRHIIDLRAPVHSKTVAPLSIFSSHPYDSSYSPHQSIFTLTFLQLSQWVFLRHVTSRVSVPFLAAYLSI
jgi:hypothetical protein